MEEEINEWSIAIPHTVNQTSDSLTWKTRTINPEVMIVPPENSIAVLKQSFLFNKFAIHTSSTNMRDGSRSQACHKMARTTEWTQKTRKQSNEWMVYAPVNVKPQGEGRV